MKAHHYLLASCLLTATSTVWAQQSTCQKVAQATQLVQKTVAEQGAAIADHIMSGLTDELFRLDCINKISLFGGVRLYAPGDLAALLKKETCEEINRWVDKANAHITRRFSAWDDQFGAHVEAGVRPQKAKPVLLPERQTIDLNGDLVIGIDALAPEDGLDETLRELFR